MQEHAVYCCGLFLEEWLMVNSMKIKAGKMIENLGGEILTSQCINLIHCKSVKKTSPIE